MRKLRLKEGKWFSQDHTTHQRVKQGPEFRAEAWVALPWILHVTVDSHVTSAAQLCFWYSRAQKNSDKRIPDREQDELNVKISTVRGNM